MLSYLRCMNTLERTPRTFEDDLETIHVMFFAVWEGLRQIKRLGIVLESNPVDLHLAFLLDVKRVQSQMKVRLSLFALWSKPSLTGHRV